MVWSRGFIYSNIALDITFIFCLFLFVSAFASLLFQWSQRICKRNSLNVEWKVVFLFLRTASMQQTAFHSAES